MAEQRDKSRQVGQDKRFYVATNISKNDKIKAGNMSRHFQSMSRHKVQKSASQGKTTMSRQPQQNAEEELCHDIGFYCHDKG